MNKDRAVSLKHSDDYEEFKKLLMSDVEKMKEDLITLPEADVIRKQAYIQGIRYVFNRLENLTQD